MSSEKSDPSTAPGPALTPIPLAPPPKRRRGRILLALVVVSLIACGAWLWTSYLLTHRSITDNLPIPPVVAQTIKPHFLFSIHDISAPLGVAVSPDGRRIYVTESAGQRRILAFDRDGKQLGQFAPPNFNAAASVPISVALDRKGRVLVSDGLRRTIDIYDAGGNYKKSISSPEEQGWMPIGLRMDGDILLVVNRTATFPIVLGLNLDGKTMFQFGKEGPNEEPGGGEPGTFYQPDTAIRDWQGRFYVSDSVNQRVSVFSKAHKFLYSLDGLSLPRGMAIDENEKLYVADAIGQTVWVFDTSGEQAKLLFNFGEFGTGDGEFNYPNDIAIDGTGRLYIADRASNRIQVWTY